MIITTLRMTAPPDKRDEFLRALRLLMGPVGVEPGCLSCHVYRNAESENELIITQEWATQADLDHHLRTDDFRKVLIMLELSSEPPGIPFHTIIHTAGIEAIENAQR